MQYRVKQALEEKSEEVSSYKMKMELENQRFAEEQASQELHFQAEREVLDKQVTTERNDRLALKKDLEERLERQEKQHMAAAEELIRDGRTARRHWGPGPVGPAVKPKSPAREVARAEIQKFNFPQAAGKFYRL